MLFISSSVSDRTQYTFFKAGGVKFCSLSCISQQPSLQMILMLLLVQCTYTSATQYTKLGLYSLSTLRKSSVIEGWGDKVWSIWGETSNPHSLNSRCGKTSLLLGTTDCINPQKSFSIMWKCCFFRVQLLTIQMTAKKTRRKLFTLFINLKF